MGCSLCTLRKRDEHYTLLYEIAQVKGKVSPEDTVEAFRGSREPIVLQVLCGSPAPSCHGNREEAQLVDVCTQTDITFEHIMALAKLRPSTPPLPDLCPFLLSDSCHSLQTVQQELFEGSELLSQTPAGGERVEEFECEEVELYRQNSQEKLGLTLCYRTDEEDLAIYVSEVDPNSIAARDGRIREGDRILQINGLDIQSREEAVTALSIEDCCSFLLLVTRADALLEEGWPDEEQNGLQEELKMEMLEGQGKENVHQTSGEEQQFQPRVCGEEDDEEEEVTSDTPTCSSHTQDWTPAEPELSSGSPECSTAPRVHTMAHREGHSGGACSLQRDRTPGEGGSGFHQRVEVNCRLGRKGDVSYSSRYTVECSLREERGGIQQELRLLSEELRSIERECRSIMQARSLHPAPERSDWDSSSAYNTAESSRSTPLTARRSLESSLPAQSGSCSATTGHRTLCRTAAGPGPRTVVSLKPGSELLEPERNPPLSISRPCARVPAASVPAANVPAANVPLANVQVARVPAANIPAANVAMANFQVARVPAANVPAASVPAHARHYQSYMQLIQQSASVEAGHSETSLLSACWDPQQQPLKLRPPLARRTPARDRLLRERALRIREERRGGGTTTDDDAVSELKLGRYWSREERKQQLLRARERRRRELMMRGRLDHLQESGAEGSGPPGRGDASILELSHRKMMKRRNRKILENWMTIQELMSHGARTPEDPGVHSAFLSVTTV